MIDTLTFFHSLFEHKAPDDLIEVRVIKGQQTFVKRQFFLNPKDLIPFCDEHSQYNLFYSVCPRHSEGGKKEHVSQVPALWADLDHFTFEKEDWIEHLKFILTPSMVVDSGRGLHVYWLLDKPVGPDDFEKVEEINRKISKLLDADSIPDISRILRVPESTNHKYDHKPMCYVLWHNPAIRYNLGDLERATIPNIPVDIFDRFNTFTPKGDRSEIEFAIMKDLLRLDFSEQAVVNAMSYKNCGKKTREEAHRGNGEYLERSVRRAVEAIREEAEEELAFTFAGEGDEEPEQKKPTKKQKGLTPEGISERDNQYILRKGKKISLLATYVFHPKILIRGMMDKYVGEIKTPEGTQFPAALDVEDFSTVVKLNKALGKAECTFLGRDANARELSVFIYQQFRNSGGLEKEGVEYVGRHHEYYICPEGVLCKERNEYLPPEESPYHLAVKDVNSVPPIAFSQGPLDLDQLQTLANNLFKINRPQVMYPAIGWMVAAFMKTEVHKETSAFPLLQVFGVRESGKTTLVTEVLMPLSGYRVAKPMSAMASKFPKMALLSGSMTVPVCYTEFREGDRDQASFLSDLRSTYDGAVNARGKQDQTIEMYARRAPVIIDGESSFSDAATIDRTILVSMNSEDLLDSTNSYEKHLRVLKKLNLNNIAKFLILHTLRTNYLPFHTKAEGLISASLNGYSHRIQRNHSIVLAGLMVFENFLQAQGIDFKLDINEVLESFKPSLISALPGKRSQTPATIFIEDLINHLTAKDTMDDGQIVFIKNPNEPILWFHFSTAYGWWSAEIRRRGQGQLNLGLGNIRKDIENQPMIIKKATKWRGNKQYRMWGINLDIAKETLDIAQ